jgi:hypothetical protein
VKTDLVECKYCGKFFCPEHLGPRLPYLPNFESTTKETRNAINSWRKPGGHPCPPYYDYLKNKEKEEAQKRWEALEGMRNLRVRREEYEISGIPPVKPQIRRRNWAAIALAIIILTIVAFWVIYLLTT